MWAGRSVVGDDMSSYWSYATDGTQVVAHAHPEPDYAENMAELMKRNPLVKRVGVCLRKVKAATVRRHLQRKYPDLPVIVYA